MDILRTVWQGIADAWTVAVKKPLANLLVLLTAYTGNLGLSVILVSVIIQLLFTPLTIKRYKTMQKIADVYPQLRKLYKKYKNNPIKLKQAQQQLYAKHNIKPATNWVLILISIPILIALYRIIFLISQGGIDQLVPYLYPQTANLVEVTNLQIETAFWGINLLENPHFSMIALLFVTSMTSSITTYMFYNYLPKEETINQLKEQFAKNSDTFSDKDVEALAHTLYYTRYVQFVVGSLFTAIILMRLPALISLYLIAFSGVQTVQNLILYFITKGGVTLPKEEQV